MRQFRTSGSVGASGGRPPGATRLRVEGAFVGGKACAKRRARWGATLVDPTHLSATTFRKPAGEDERSGIGHANSALVCDDGKLCTSDSCDMSSGKFVANTLACDGGDGCTRSIDAAGRLLHRGALRLMTTIIMADTVIGNHADVAHMAAHLRICRPSSGLLEAGAVVERPGAPAA